MNENYLVYLALLLFWPTMRYILWPFICVIGEAIQYFILHRAYEKISSEERKREKQIKELYGKLAEARELIWNLIHHLDLEEKDKSKVKAFAYMRKGELDSPYKTCFQWDTKNTSNIYVSPDIARVPWDDDVYPGVGK